ncbi:hypothetical protein NPX13_g509 [Xylaria arbuscula]|uniref:NACHT domain-containing protein n=1 Tax=Xylaria arbuscula TaxID=114810 RepID=A0A9W8NNE9_9PEZI|nr:hypothetical protein NPX13_g509 [Xylaria arbuscula]
MVYDDSSRSSQRTGGVKLNQVYPPPESDTITDVDVIAIHGLDTNSTTTWTWNWKDRDPEKRDVNWLKDPDMLPRRIRTARGIILIQALVIAAASGSGYSSLWEASGGVVFLATPFRGTAFREIASTAIKFLKGYGSLTDRVVTDLLSNLQESTPFLQDLVGSFTSICVQRRQRGRPCRLAIFYETETTNLLRKLWPPFMKNTRKGSRPLVDSGSARLDIVSDPIPLQRSHVLMNKFGGPEDPGYDAVSGKVEIIICEICQAGPIDKANAWIRNEQYSLKRLGIERLSGELLPMDRCYINLAIVERPRKQTGIFKEHNEMRRDSPFSLFSRLRVETFQKEIMLSTIFEPRETRNGQMRPSRILIRGRAGVGKTTLCKKIIYEFTHCKLWQDLFDCVFWVPLRNLKLEGRRQNLGYNLKSLFYHEYLTQHPEGEDLADKLWHALTDTKANKMLFVLDGLDEVLDLDDTMLHFLPTLLNQPNVIITSRPNANLPPDLDSIHLELETIGFHPAQVNAYIENAFTDLQTGDVDSAKMEEIQSFLNNHRIIQGLVRIPIQLDALCYSWDNSPGSYSTSIAMPDSMTAIYQRIEESLWRKDVVRLEIWNRNKAQIARRTELFNVVNHELECLGSLAFTGMLNNVINFEAKHRDAISEHCSHRDQRFLLDEMLERVSFVRSSDSSSKKRHQSYHFLHLTFQEYFAARYFAQQWKDQGKLKCIVFGHGEGKATTTDTVEFLRKNKYTPRYDIFWRFVAGLLNTEGTTRFFQAIEEEPRDLLGPVHQRLVMCCLSEVSKDMLLRKPLEGQLSQWLLFECELTSEPRLPSVTEFPVEILKNTLAQEHNSTLGLLDSLTYRKGSFGELTQTIAAYITDEDPRIKIVAFEALQGQPLTEQHIQSTIECVTGDKDWDVRVAAIEALRGQPLTEQHLQAIITCLTYDKNPRIRMAITACVTGDENPRIRKAITACVTGDKDWDVRKAAIDALRGQPLTEQLLQTIIICLTDSDPSIGGVAIAMLKTQPKLPRRLLTPLAGLLKHKSMIVKERAVEILRSQPNSEDLFQAVALYLEDIDWGVRTSAIETLKDRPELPDQLLRVVTKAEIAECRPALSGTFFLAVLADLKHNDSCVRDTALEALLDPPALPGGILQAIVILLEDEDWAVRTAALEALQNQPALPEGVYQAVGLLFLKEESESVREKAVELLVSLRDLSSISSIQIEIIYETLLKRSCRQYVSWKVEGGFSRIMIGDKEYLADWPDLLTSVVQEVQKRLGVPPHLDMRP